jgi:uncharacterized protein DUF5684
MNPQIEAPSPALMIVAGLFGLVFAIFMAASLWKVYSKAGEPGWASIVPIYNVIVLLKIAGRPMWWLLLLIVPVANVIVPIILNFDLARKFGKGAGFGFGLLLFPVICFPILGFGSSRYNAAA